MCVGMGVGAWGGLSKSVNAHYGSSEPLLLIDSSAARPFGLCCQLSLDGFYKRSHSHCVFITFFFPLM